MRDLNTRLIALLARIDQEIADAYEIGADESLDMHEIFGVCNTIEGLKMARECVEKLIRGESNNAWAARQYLSGPDQNPPIPDTYREALLTILSRMDEFSAAAEQLLADAADNDSGALAEALRELLVEMRAIVEGKLKGLS
jgi:hypothetical protein